MDRLRDDGSEMKRRGKELTLTLSPGDISPAVEGDTKVRTHIRAPVLRFLATGLWLCSYAYQAELIDAPYPMIRDTPWHSSHWAS